MPRSAAFFHGGSLFLPSSTTHSEFNLLTIRHADVVQFRLERMVDELEDLGQCHIFNRKEIAEIVTQRRKFEHELKRPSPLKQDFLAYTEYETT